MKKFAVKITVVSERTGDKTVGYMPVFPAKLVPTTFNFGGNLAEAAIFTEHDHLLLKAEMLKLNLLLIRAGLAGNAEIEIVDVLDEQIFVDRLTGN